VTRSRLGRRSSRRRAASLAPWLAAAAAFAAVAASAAIPTPEKVTGAVASANAAAGRAVPLLLHVRLRIDGGAPSAEGELAVHPSGLARLELRNRWGFVERHLLQGSSYQASRDGELLSDPHPFLPPLFLLQATSGDALAAALASYGIAEQQVALGRMGTHDCYVIGGRLVGRASGEEPLLPSMWVDMVTFEPLRVVRADGVEYRFGPNTVFSGIRVPSWVDIQSGQGLRARLEIVDAARADAPAALFQADWLTTPPAAPAE